MCDVYLNNLGILCALGADCQEVSSGLFQKQSSALTFSGAYSTSPLPLGIVSANYGIEKTHLPIPDRSRNNVLLLSALHQIRSAVDHAISHFGKDRVGIVIGTSTSGMEESVSAFEYRATCSKLCFPANYHYSQQEIGSPAAALQKELGTSGPAFVHSSACSSGAKAIISGARMLAAGICDAVIAGAADTLNAFVVSGFSSLEAVSKIPCIPFSANRTGISLGEGTALFLMTREPSMVRLSGWGESSDGYHISSPAPDGRGARLAIKNALKKAGLMASDIDYINLHGTGTLQNDAMESAVVHELFGKSVYVSSTKGMIGHTLGAAGAIEAGICWLAMHKDNPTGKLPPHIWDGIPDDSLPQMNMVCPNTCLGRRIQHCISNSFAFGGSNASLVFSRGDA